GGPPQRRKSERRNTWSAKWRPREFRRRTLRRPTAKPRPRNSQSPRLRDSRPGFPGGSYAALNLREFLPDFDAAEMRALSANRCGNAGPYIAGRTDVTAQFGQRRADLRDFFHRRLVDLFLSVETRAHRPFMKQVQKRTALDEPDGF